MELHGDDRMMTMTVTVMQLREMLVQKAVTSGLRGSRRIFANQKEVRRMENLLPQRMRQWWPRNFHRIS